MHLPNVNLSVVSRYRAVIDRRALSATFLTVKAVRRLSKSVDRWHAVRHVPGMTDLSPDRLKRILDYDPLYEAEKIAGRRTDASAALGFVFAQESSRVKQEVLAERDDSVFSSDYENYRRIIESMGFKMVFEESFEHTFNDGDPAATDFYRIFARRDGLILDTDSYSYVGGSRRTTNGAKLHFNLRLEGDKWPSRCSGTCVRENGAGWGDADYQEGGASVWVGDTDAREAIRYRLGDLSACGTFLCKWVRRPWFSLTHHGDKKRGEYGSYYEAATAERVVQLPDWVQDILRDARAH